MPKGEGRVKGRRIPGLVKVCRFRGEAGGDIIPRFGCHERCARVRGYFQQKLEREPALLFLYHSYK